MYRLGTEAQLDPSCILWMSSFCTWVWSHTPPSTSWLAAGSRVYAHKSFPSMSWMQVQLSVKAVLGVCSWAVKAFKCLCKRKQMRFRFSKVNQRQTLKSPFKLIKTIKTSLRKAVNRGLLTTMRGRSSLATEKQDLKTLYSLNRTCKKTNKPKTLNVSNFKTPQLPTKSHIMPHHNDIECKEDI